MYKSLFSRLSFSLFSTLLLITIIIATTLSIIVAEDPKRLLSERLLRYNIEKIGIPPSNKNLKQFSEQLQISLTVTGEDNFLWNSRKGLPQPNLLESLTSPDTQFDFLRLGTFKQVVLLRHKNFSYYISDYEGQLSSKAKLTLVLAIISILLVLFINRRFIHWLFHPLKQLKADAIKISEGDIEHHIITNRKDELGELTQSVNAMAEKLQNNIRSKRQLLLAISHELRTPLARAKMYLSLMPKNEYQEKLDNNLNTLNSLIEALLQSETLGDSREELNITEVNMNLLIQEIINEYETDRIYFKAAQQSYKLQADKLRIKLLISNLLNNALQYTDDIVEIELYYQNKNIQCIIKDHGKGIAKDEIPHLTEAFYRPDKSRQRKTGNYGLGLYLCQKIIDAHSGKLEIKSKLGQGTSIILSFETQDQISHRT